ncbi:MAG TPA: AAA family ATPase [Pseudomonadales bacterium]|nr:AAA family ATPase [Pseudomonadales bacterium]
MYQDYFDLERSPFSIAPDPHFLYMSERHREALAHLLWGLESDGGFVLLTGEVGTGKTTLSRCLLEKIPADTDLAFVINPRVTVTELLATLCDELGIPAPEADQASVKRLVDRINKHLLAAHAEGRRTVVVIDEAQNLSPDVLEQIRLLTNLETSERKLLQVILIGQPELATMLRRPDLRQLAQRITARYHLEPLRREELAALIEHRLNVAGARRNPFTARALRVLHRRSRGIPRLANVIADRALLGAFAGSRDRVTPDIVRRAATEVLGEAATGPRWRRPTVLAASALGLAALATLVALRLLPMAGSGTTTAAATAPTPAQAIAATLPATATTTAEEDAATAPAPADDPDPGSLPDDGTAPATRMAAVLDEAGRAALDALWTRPPSATRDAAVEAVLVAWGTPMTLDPGTAACAQVDAVGLNCLEHEGNWPSLAVLDRPVVLELWQEGQAQARYAAAVAADAGTLDLIAGDQRIRIPRAELDRIWRGRATLLWQLPPGYTQPTRRGDAGITTDWLRARLDVADGGAPDAAATGPFDDALEARVRSFQLREGVRPDGIAGPHTWIRLNGRTAAGVPSLASGAPR